MFEIMVTWVKAFKTRFLKGDDNTSVVWGAHDEITVINSLLRISDSLGEDC